MKIPFKVEPALLRFSLTSIGISVLAYLTAWRWAIDATLYTTAYSGPGGYDYVRSRHRFCVIDPSWVGRADDQSVWIRWVVAEMKARLAVVFILLCAAMILNFIWASRKNYSTPSPPR